MKSLVASCPEAFAELILRRTGLKVTSRLSTELKGYDLNADGLLTVEMEEGEEVLMLVEFQSVNDKNMGERLLDYSFRAKRDYDKTVYACVIYLRKDGIVPEPPLRWEFRNGKKILVFDYVCIKLWEMTAEELLAFKQPALLPLTLLTKEGANRIIVGEMFESLLASGQQDLLPVGNLLAGLALGDSDLEWLKRKYNKMTDILKDSPAYRWMTDDAREEGLEQGREQGLEQGRKQGLELGRQQEYEVSIKQLGEVLLEVVTGRFPRFVRLAKKQIRDAKDAERLQHVLIKVSLAHENDDIEPYLWELDEEFA